jgi:single-strand DNA-binding protein
VNSLNSILLEGNLVRDPESGETPKGTQFCKFSIASNRFYKHEGAKVDEVSYFDVEVWAKLAENCHTNLEKGRGVRVVGRLKQDRWQDEEGKGKTKIKIVGEHVEFKPQFKKIDKTETSNDNDEDDKDLTF